MAETAHFSLIIPTLNRPNILRETLVSVFKQDLLPKVIYIVDQSEGNETRDLCSQFSSVKYIYSDVRSLTKARNIGIKASIAAGVDFWIFLDDDVELEQGYFRIINKAFADNDSIIGITAWVNTLTPIKRGFIANILRFFGGFDYNSSCVKIRANFLATSVKTIPSDWIKVEWFSGCAMSARNLKDKNIFFDENLILYALAEDRDYSYRLSKIGDTVLIPELQLLHKVTSEWRIPSRKKTFMVAVHQYYLVKKHFGDSLLNALMYWWNMSIRWIISLFVSFIGYASGNVEMARSGQDIRKSFYYVIQNRHKLKKLDMRFFHEFLSK